MPIVVLENNEINARSRGSPWVGGARMPRPARRLVSLVGAIIARVRWATMLAAVVVLAFLVVGAPRAYAHYGADGADGAPSTLYWIEPATLEATRIGPVGYALVGIARGHDDGNLYGVTSARDPRAPNSLILIDFNTGAGTLIGPLGLPDG